MKRGGRLPQQSKKRQGEREERAEVVRLAWNAEGGRCGLWWLADPALAARAGLEPVPCRGGPCGHEVAHRSVMKGSHLVEDLVAGLCVGHNGWEDVQVQDVAERVGVRASAWVVDQFGAEAVGAECRRIRFSWGMGRDPGPPFWRATE